MGQVYSVPDPGRPEPPARHNDPAKAAIGVCAALVLLVLVFCLWYQGQTKAEAERKSQEAARQARLAAAPKQQAPAGQPQEPAGQAEAEPAPPLVDLLDLRVEHGPYSSEAVGRLRNNSRETVSLYLEFAVYDGAGDRIGTAFDVVRGLGPGETWRFQAVYLGSGAREFRMTDARAY